MYLSLFYLSRIFYRLTSTFCYILQNISKVWAIELTYDLLHDVKWNITLTPPIRLPGHDRAHLALARGGGGRDPELVHLVLLQPAHLRVVLLLPRRVRHRQLRVLTCPIDGLGYYTVFPIDTPYKVVNIRSA